MARPKSGRPPKRSLNLTVSEQGRLNLQYVSSHCAKSISELVEEWAAKEARRISKETGRDVPNAAQLTLDDLNGEI